MSRQRWVGLSILALGAVALVVAAVGTLAGGDGGGTAASTTSQAPVTTEPATSAPETSTTTMEPPTTAAPTTTAPASTTVASTTTAAPVTTSSTTTAPVPTEEDVRAFIEAYAAAVAGGDGDFLVDRLHPVVLGSFDADACRTFVEEDILTLVDYRLAGDITRESRTFTVGGESVTVDPLFVAPVAFTFQGVEFTVDATFAPVDGEMRWFSECR